LRLLLLVTSLLAISCRAEDIESSKKTIRFLVSDAWSMPFGKFEKINNQTKLTSGAIKDWQEALAIKLGRKSTVIIVPFVRVARTISGQEADVECFISPDWVPAEMFEWPSPMFSIEEQFVGDTKHAIIISVDDLIGKSVGTVAGYHYPILEKLFKSKSILRDDAPSEESAYQKQIRNRTDYMVMRSVDFAYRKKSDPSSANLNISPLIISKTPIYCARIKGGSVSLKELEAAQRLLLSSKTFEKILQSYL